MDKLYLFVPQWQDSGLVNELYSGAFTLKQYFESILDNTFIEVIISPIMNSFLENNIYGFSIIKQQLFEISKQLNNENPSKVITLGGGCGIEVPIVSYLSSKYKDLKIFWFDAHGDLNTPETSPSKYFHGMPLRFITEKQNNEIGDMFNTILPENICLIGARDLDPSEEIYISEKQINVIKINLEIEKKMASATSPGKYAFIHIDLDVIDPKEYKNVKCPVNNGLKINDLKKYINMIVTEMNVVGMSIVESTETDIKKVSTLREILKIAINV